MSFSMCRRHMFLQMMIYMQYPSQMMRKGQRVAPKVNEQKYLSKCQQMFWMNGQCIVSDTNEQESLLTQVEMCND